MTEMILNFIQLAVYTLIYFSLLILTFSTLTWLNKVYICRKFNNKGIKLKCVRWKPFSNSFFPFVHKKVYLVEYIKKDGRVSKTWLKSKFLL
ncbi:hypothetical protein [Candidatus Marinarcus aquaticus]|uniref:Uncharacterized protein n=1 Tax=Candidatus Marinarcus aquaticus TaxID=2044504 RepID=A0A4Q0XX02_9BACT|nr:hypothetical protein [Candidatus Marinarcus aquaticus]RXJ60819.1 hypothetical protein CRV04_02050 [Candidatus Marinarcus aquaticus]